MLLAEGYDVGASLVKAEVAEWKRQRREVFVPLVYRPGDLAEVDFFEVLVDVAGAREKAWMFVMRLMHSGRDFAWLYPRQDQVGFLDGHVRAFAHFGAVPQRIAYDNLKAAVAQDPGRLGARADGALPGARVALPASSRASAGPATGHDKGGVGVARQSDPLAAPGADPGRARPRERKRGASGPARWPAGRSAAARRERAHDRRALRRGACSMLPLPAHPLCRAPRRTIRASRGADSCRSRAATTRCRATGRGST